MAKKQKGADPQVGEFTPKNGNTHRGTVSGVMLMANVPDPSGQWWVGGEQIALVRATNKDMKLTTLWKRVRDVVKLFDDVGTAVIALHQHTDFVVVWQKDGVVGDRS